MDISNITDLTTLKSMAYDEISKAEQAQKNLQALNQQIANVMNGTAIFPNPKDTAQEQLPLGPAADGSENAPTESPADAPTDEPAAPAE